MSDDIGHREMRQCEECCSKYFASASLMSRLCPECAHWLYRYPRCAHEFVRGCCSMCGWDGSVSEYLRALQAQPGE
jgi:predicted RNA-binding Zn-ribbon protein involved in translation (DUF1610 family)